MLASRIRREAIAGKDTPQLRRFKNPTFNTTHGEQSLGCKAAKLAPWKRPPFRPASLPATVASRLSGTIAETSREPSRPCIR